MVEKTEKRVEQEREKKDGSEWNGNSSKIPRNYIIPFLLVLEEIKARGEFFGVKRGKTCGFS